MNKYTIEYVNKITNEWLYGNSEKSKKAWKKILQDIHNYDL